MSPQCSFWEFIKVYQEHKNVSRRTITVVKDGKEEEIDIHSQTQKSVATLAGVSKDGFETFMELFEMHLLEYHEKYGYQTKEEARRLITKIKNKAQKSYIR